MTPAQICTSCGAAVTPATSFLSEAGLLCWPCFTRWETKQRAAEQLDADLNRHLQTQAHRIGGLHFLSCAAEVILLSTWTNLPGWLSSALIAGAFILAIGLWLRSPLASRAALVVDGVGPLALLIVAGAMRVGLARFALAALPALFGWWLGWTVWRARPVFVASAARDAIR